MYMQQYAVADGVIAENEIEFVVVSVCKSDDTEVHGNVEDEQSFAVYGAVPPVHDDENVTDCPVTRAVDDAEIDGVERAGLTVIRSTGDETTFGGVDESIIFAE